MKRLQGDLERGQVDPQLLKELGWTEDRMAQFVQRMQEQLKDRGEDPSPEAVARRLQFEETLKNLQLTRAIKKHSGETSNKRRTQHIQARDVPVPPEYRESYNSYTKSLSKSPAGK